MGLDEGLLLIIRQVGTAGTFHQNSNAFGAGRKVAQAPGHLRGLTQSALLQKVLQGAYFLIKAVKLDRHASDFILIYMRHGLLPILPEVRSRAPHHLRAETWCRPWSGIDP